MKLKCMALLLLACIPASYAQPGKDNGISPADTSKVLALDSLANAFSKKPDSAKKFIEAGWPIVRRLNYKRGEALMTYDQGILYLEANRNDSALAAFNKAIPLFSALGDTRFVGKVYKDMALVYLYKADHVRAMKLILQAQDIFEKSRSMLDLPVCYSVKGYIYTQQGALRECLQAQEQGYRIADSLLHSPEAQRSAQARKTIYLAYIDGCKNLSNTYSRSGDFDHAIEYINKGLAVSEAQEFLGARIKFMIGYAIVQVKTGKTSGAIATFQRAIQLSAGNALYYNEAACYANLAPLLADRNAAIRTYDTAILLTEQKVNDLDFLLDILKEKYTYAQEQGLYQVAIETSERYHAMKDSIFSVEKEVAIKNLESVNELAKATATIRENELRSLRSRHVSIIAGMALLIVVVALVIILFYQSRLKKLHQQVLAQNHDLTRLNATKDKMFSVISHDLRSPLHSLSGLIYYARSNEVIDGEVDELLGQVNKQLLASAAIMDRLLQWGSDEFKGNPVIKMFPVMEELQATLQAIRHEANEKGIAFTADVGPSLQITTNPYHFDFTVRNLLQNAVKYTGKGGSVALKYTFENNAHVFEVQDTGIGMPAATMNALFKDIVNSEYGTQGEKGIGIALMLAGQYARADGNILSASAGSSGSVFRYAIPARG